MNWGNSFERYRQFLTNFPLGVAVGAIIGATFAFVLSAEIETVLKDYFSSLVTILVTAISAGLATFGVLLTIEHQEKIRREEKSNKLRASRAVLASVLGEISTNAEENCRIVLAVSRLMRDGEEHNDELSRYENFSVADIRPFISNTESETFKNCIEFSDPVTANWLVAISNCYQISQAQTLRFGIPELYDDLKRIDNCKALRLCHQWLLVRNITNHCFEFARGEHESVSDVIPLAALESGLWPEASFWVGEYPEYDALKSFQRQQSILFLGLPKEDYQHPNTISVSQDQLRKQHWIDF